MHQPPPPGQKRFKLFQFSRAGLLTVVLACAIVFSFFVPTPVFLYKGSIRTGPYPVWAAYYGLLIPEFRTMALPIVAAHATICTALATLSQWITRKQKPKAR